jgi:hypothetical protein
MRLNFLSSTLELKGKIMSFAQKVEITRRWHGSTKLLITTCESFFDFHLEPLASMYIKHYEEGCFSVFKFENDPSLNYMGSNEEERDIFSCDNWDEAYPRYAPISDFIDEVEDCNISKAMIKFPDFGLCVGWCSERKIMELATEWDIILLRSRIAGRRCQIMPSLATNKVVFPRQDSDSFGEVERARVEEIVHLP